MPTIAESTIALIATSEPRLAWVRPRLEIADIKEITCTGAGSGTDGGTVGMTMVSDVRLKKNITRVGVSASGLPIYSFQYIWGGPTVVGVWRRICWRCDRTPCCRTALVSMLWITARSTSSCRASLPRPSGWRGSRTPLEISQARMAGRSHSVSGYPPLQKVWDCAVVRKPAQPSGDQRDRPTSRSNESFRTRVDSVSRIRPFADENADLRVLCPFEFGFARAGMVSQLRRMSSRSSQAFFFKSKGTESAASKSVTSRSG